MMIRIKKWFVCFLSLVVLGVLPLTALAAEKGSVTILFEPEERAIQGAVFHLYKIAEADKNGDYKLTGNFTKYPVSVDGIDGENTAVIASTLAAYAARDKVAADADKETNAHGAFKVEDLTEGVYLLTGEPVTMENTLYIPQPGLIFIPSVDEEGNVVYDLTLMPKYEKRELTGESLTRSALKIWKDEGYTSHRPQEITVQLLRNGEVYDEQVLNEANNWKYTWSKLDAAYNWQLLEKSVPGGYETKAEQQGVTFTVTNTFNDPNTPPDAPADTPKDPTLPQTGMLWWPVPVLLIIGLMLCVAGYIVYRSRKQNEKA